MSIDKVPPGKSPGIIPGSKADKKTEAADNNQDQDKLTLADLHAASQPAQSNTIKTADISDADIKTFYEGMHYFMMRRIQKAGLVPEIEKVRESPVVSLFMHYLNDPNCEFGTHEAPMPQRALYTMRNLDSDFRFQGRPPGQMLVFADNTKMIQGIFEDMNFSYIHAEGFDLHFGTFNRINFANSMMHGARFDGSEFNEAILQDGDFNSASFVNADFPKANFRKAILCNARFERTRMSGANLQNTRIANANFGEAVMVGVGLQNAHALNFQQEYRLQAKFEMADLSLASFKEAALGRTSFDDANLSGAVLSLASRHPSDVAKESLSYPVNELYMDGTNLEKAQIFLDADAKEPLSETDSRTKVIMYMNGTNLKGATIVNASLFPERTDSTYLYPGHEPRAEMGDGVLNNLQEAYLRNVDIHSMDILVMCSMSDGCRYTPDTKWPDGYQPSGTEIDITDWSNTNLREHKFDKNFMIQSTMEKTEEAANKIKSIDLSGADCSGADFTDFYEYYSLCNWQGTKIDGAKGVTKNMILAGAQGTPQKPVIGCIGDQEQEALLRAAEAGAYHDNSKTKPPAQ